MSGKFSFFPGFPVKRADEYAARTDIEHIRTPSSSPPGIHVLIHLFVNLVCLFIVRFISCPGEDSVLVARILELVWFDFWLFSSPGLGLSAKTIKSFEEQNIGERARNRLCRRTFSNGTDIRTGSETRDT